MRSHSSAVRLLLTIAVVTALMQPQLLAIGPEVGERVPPLAGVERVSGNVCLHCLLNGG